MKIAMIGLRGLEDGLGGVEKAVREIAVRLVEQGEEVTCYCRPKYNSEKEYKGVKLINTATFYSKHLETAFYAIGALFHAMRGDYDIIHIHAMASSTLLWLPRWFSKKHIVVTMHGLDWQRAKWGFFAKSILKFGEYSAVHCASNIICVSLSMQIYFNMRYLYKRFHYIPNGCDMVDTEEIPELNELKGIKYILYMGRIVPEKGIHKLLYAFKQLPTSDTKLIIAGPQSHAKEYYSSLQDLARGDERIEFVGTVTGDRKESLLAHAYLFVLPSDIEGLPIALIEAASYGVCPVISGIPTAIEVLGERDLSRGFVFNPQSIKELTTVLETALDAPELVDMLGKVARDNVQANYNWDRIANETRQAYKEIC